MQPLPTGAKRLTMPRSVVSSAAFQPNATGRLSLHAIRLKAGDVLTTASFMSGTTAGATLTHVWFALYDANRALLRVTNDDTAATWAANTVKTLTFATSYTVPADGTYYLGIVVVGTTMPTLMGGTTVPAAVNTVPPIAVGTSTSSLVAPGTAPNPAAALTAVAGGALAWVG